MRRLSLLVLVLGLLATTVGVALAELPPGGTFTDDDGNIHEGNIEAIAAEGITKGCNPPTNDRYCPDGFVTRGQMAAFVRRALSLPLSSTDFFVDDDDSVFEGDINAVALAGITKGCNPPANDRFCPEGNTTREQMAAFLRRAFDYPAATIDYFTDDVTSIFEADINAIAKAGVTLGCNPPTNDRYCPTALVKRDQMASFLARSLDPPPVFPPPKAEPFGDGVWVVGVDIAPGTYRTDSALPGWCSGARLSGFSGEPGDVIASKRSQDPFFVTIEATDAGFSSTNCGMWTNDLTPRTISRFADFWVGYWSVGDEVAPGLWLNYPGEWCAWQRLGGFSWEPDDVIAGGAEWEVFTVRIEDGDRAFWSNEFCGTWTYLGP